MQKTRSADTIKAIRTSQLFLTIWRTTENRKFWAGGYPSWSGWRSKCWFSYEDAILNQKELGQPKAFQSIYLAYFSSASLNFFIDQVYIKHIYSWSQYKILTIQNIILILVIQKQDLHLPVDIHHIWLEIKINIKNAYISLTCLNVFMQEVKFFIFIRIFQSNYMSFLDI